MLSEAAWLIYRQGKVSGDKQWYFQQETVTHRNLCNNTSYSFLGIPSPLPSFYQNHWNTIKTPGFSVVSKVELAPISEYLLNTELYIIMQVDLQKKSDIFSAF